jgi:hypothetical protein
MDVGATISAVGADGADGAIGKVCTGTGRTARGRGEEEGTDESTAMA